MLIGLDRPAHLLVIGTNCKEIRLRRDVWKVGSSAAQRSAGIAAADSLLPSLVSKVIPESLEKFFADVVFVEYASI